MKNISIIVALDLHNAIGKNNKLLCHLPNDLRRFKIITAERDIIMGKNTFLSLPNGALPNKNNIIISDDRRDVFENCIMAYSIEEALQKCNHNSEIFIIGGATIYEQFMKYANKLYLTYIYHVFDGADAFFPKIDYSKWILIEKYDFYPDKRHKYFYSYAVFKKK